MIGVVATIRIQDGKASEFEQVFAELTQKVRANEPGNLLYQLTRTRADPNAYKVLELYRDQESLTAHGSSEHFREIGRRMGPCLAGRPEIEYLDGVG
ncbi:MAG: putative quinol monooxygenase [Caulobacteraceae bacterium]